MGDKLDTSAIIDFLSNENDLKSKYSSITSDWNTVVQGLEEHFKGYGADAFFKDTKKVSCTLDGVGDVLKTMCDTLRDCLDVYNEADVTLGKSNSDSSKE